MFSGLKPRANVDMEPSTWLVVKNETSSTAFLLNHTVIVGMRFEVLP